MDSGRRGEDVVRWRLHSQHQSFRVAGFYGRHCPPEGAPPGCPASFLKENRIIVLDLKPEVIVLLIGLLTGKIRPVNNVLAVVVAFREALFGV